MIGVTFDWIKIEVDGADLLDGVDHGEAHVDAEDGVVGPLNRSTADAIITIPQDLDAYLVVPLQNNNNNNLIMFIKTGTNDLIVTRTLLLVMSSWFQLSIILIIKRLLEPVGRI